MLGNLFRMFGYSTWFVISLLAFVYLSIPTEKVRRYAQVHAGRALKTSVKIDGLELRGISGITLLGVTVQIPKKPEDPVAGRAGGLPGAPGKAAAPGTVEAQAGDESGDDEPPPRLIDPPGLVLIDELKVDVNTLGLVMGKKLEAALNVDFTGGGHLEGGRLVAVDDGWDLTIDEMSGIDLGPMRLFHRLAGVDVNTRLSGVVEAQWRGGLKESSASIELELTDTVVPHLEIKIPPSPYPVGEVFSVAVGEVDIEAKLGKPEDLPGLSKRGPRGYTTLLLEKLSARGDHIELQLDAGQRHTVVFTGPGPNDGRIDVKLVVHFTDQFFAWKGDGVRKDGSIAKNESHAAMKTVLASALHRAKIKVGKREYYGFHCRGPLKTFQCKPTAPSRRITPQLATPPPAATAAGPEPTSSRAARAKRPPPPEVKRSVNRPRPPRANTVRTPGSNRLGTRTSKPSGPTRMVERGRPGGDRRFRPRLGSRNSRNLDDEDDEDDRPDFLAPRRGGGGEITPTVGEEDDEEEPLDDEEEMLDDDEERLDDEELDDEELDEDGEPLDDEEFDDEEDEPLDDF